MKLSEFDYNLPEELIAQHPMTPRDHSRLLALGKETGEIEHRKFFEIVDLLESGDVLVFNNSKVFPARLFGYKKDTGGKMEILLLSQENESTWQAVVGGKGKREGLEIVFGGGEDRNPRLQGAGNNTRSEGEISQSRRLETNDQDFESDNNYCRLQNRDENMNLLVDEQRVFSEGNLNTTPRQSLCRAKSRYPVTDELSLKLIKKLDGMSWRVEFNHSGDELNKLIDQLGETPLPPYIKEESDPEKYQTVYAKHRGSAAAPTAGLHFTDELLEKLKAKGIQKEFVTLHVGLGTFEPVRENEIEEHQIHSEYATIDTETAQRLNQAKQEGRRIIAVGTTSTRTLEASFRNNEIQSIAEWVDIFIYPGYEFKVIDGLITNFHLPKSTLLMLISAFAGKDKIDRAYAEAIKEKYRFYSFGDGMVIL